MGCDHAARHVEQRRLGGVQGLVPAHLRNERDAGPREGRNGSGKPVEDDRAVILDGHQGRALLAPFAHIAALRHAGHYHRRVAGLVMDVARMDVAESPIGETVPAQLRQGTRRVVVMRRVAAQRGMHQPDLQRSRRRRGVFRQQAVAHALVGERDAVHDHVGALNGVGSPAPVEHMHEGRQLQTGRDARASIVIATNDEGADSGLAQPRELAREKQSGLHAVLLAIVEIARDHQRIDTLL